MTNAQLQERLNIVEKELADLKRNLDKSDAATPWMPKHDMDYFSVTEYGKIASKTNMTQSTADDAAVIGNVFRTKELVEQYKLRLESQAKRWRPAVGEPYFYWSVKDECVETDTYAEGLDYDDFIFFVGACHPTRKAAEAWGAKYGDAWKALLEVQS